MKKALILWLLCVNVVLGITENSSTNQSTDKVSILVCPDNKVIYSMYVSNTKQAFTVDKVTNNRIAESNNNTILNLVNYTRAMWIPVNTCKLYTNDNINIDVHTAAMSNSNYSEAYLKLINSSEHLDVTIEIVK